MAAGRLAVPKAGHARMVNGRTEQAQREEELFNPFHLPTSVSLAVSASR
jgi:hypothetical protein